jgi:hypothetical protein
MTKAHLRSEGVGETVRGAEERCEEARLSRLSVDNQLMGAGPQVGGHSAQAPAENVTAHRQASDASADATIAHTLFRVLMSACRISPRRITASNHRVESLLTYELSQPVRRMPVAAAHTPHRPGTAHARVASGVATQRRAGARVSENSR